MAAHQHHYPRGWVNSEGHYHTCVIVSLDVGRLVVFRLTYVYDSAAVHHGHTLRACRDHVVSGNQAYARPGGWYRSVVIRQRESAGSATRAAADQVLAAVGCGLREVPGGK
jgi:hypothetical protein